MNPLHMLIRTPRHLRQTSNTAASHQSKKILTWFLSAKSTTHILIAGFILCFFAAPCLTQPIRSVSYQFRQTESRFAIAK